MDNKKDCYFIISHTGTTCDKLVAGLRMMVERARDNLQRFKAKQPLVGQLLPYLTAEEATQQGLNFREAHGWIEEE